MTKKLLLLGGGHAHVHVLQMLAQTPLPGVEVALVTPFARQLYSGMVPGFVAGHYGIEQCGIALRPLADAADVRLIEGTAVRLDSAKRSVTLADGRQAEYDLLSLDIGGVMDRQRLPGAREHGLFVRPIEHFVRLFDGVLALASERVLDVVVIGGGAAGVELAMALQHRLAQGGAERARVALVTGGPPPLAGYAPGVMQRAAAALARSRITVFRDSVVALQPGTALLASGATLACDAPIIATGAEAPAWLQGSGLDLDARGFVITGPTLQSSSHDSVLAVGDVASRADVADPPHPRSGVHAVRAGPPLAANLRLLLAGQPALPYQPPARTLSLISCGRKSAIVSWGDGSAQGRWAWWWKDRIDRAWVARYGGTPPLAGAATAAAPLTRSDGTR